MLKFRKMQWDKLFERKVELSPTSNVRYDGMSLTVGPAFNCWWLPLAVRLQLGNHAAVAAQGST